MGTYSGVNVSLETTSIRESWSAEAPWPQLKERIVPDDAWLQITSIDYTAVDERDLASASTQRSVEVKAVAR